MSSDSKTTIYNYRERPELETRGDDLVEQWPTFMFYDPCAAQYYPSMFEHYGEFQLYWVNDADETVAACSGIPLTWDGTLDDLPAGWDDGLARGVENQRQGIAPNTLCAIQATVSPRFLGQGLGSQVVQGMRSLAQQHGFHALIAPVRPTFKSRYPLIPMENYVRWTRNDGMPFDPWLRVHHKLGAKILKVCLESMTITNTVERWETWTEMAFPESGSYIVPGALMPVTIDRETDQGVYVEPNVWMVHFTC